MHSLSTIFVGFGRLFSDRYPNNPLMKIYLMRHTSVLLNGNEHCYGFTDVDVRDTFEEEAAAACARLKGLDPEAIFTSPLQRAAKLAAFCGYPDAIRDDRLKEMNFGDWEGKPWEEILDTTDVEAFFCRYIDEPVPGGESQREQFERVRDFILEKKAAGYRSILIFCHGGVINCARTLVGQCTLESAFASLPPFGSLTELIL